MSNLINTIANLFPRCNLYTVTVVSISGRAKTEVRAAYVNPLQHGSDYEQHVELIASAPQVAEGEVDGKPYKFEYYADANMIITTAPLTEE